ncbi:glycosyltransferase family 2 protein [Pseudophaeobacter sp. 1A09344]|uniref:glycosyltransferase family 2 protein n=1 Tax=Pseudophaeobacter sp. 1A09344 TaxID=3098144 RepID=UPI0034D443AA
MSLTLALPVHNDARNLRRVLAQAHKLGVFDKVVISDDGSDEPVSRTEVCPPDAWPQNCFTILRTETNKGAGHARNRALEHVTTEHVLFFDADDLLTPDLAALIKTLAGRQFDFCLFRHTDSRCIGWGILGQMPLDEAHWRRAKVQVGALSSINPTQAAALAETTNYPWNKIYRTDFLRENNIYCSETMVHNDIELHWMSFHHGRNILVSDRVGALHFVAPSGQRLTNRKGEERFAVFAPLGRIASALDTENASERLREPFLRFTSGLFDWIRGNIAPHLQKRFDAATRDFLLTYVDMARFSQLSQADPVLARHIVLQLERGRI